MTMRVIKFSGTAIADVEPIRRAAAIVAGAGEACVVVVSALAGVTDRLNQIAEFAESGRVQVAYGILDRVVERHCRIAEAAAPGAAGPMDLVARTSAEVRALVDGIAVLRAASPVAHDAVLAAGELMASRLFASALEAHGVPAVWLDARQVFVTNGAHGRAAVDRERTAAALDRSVAPLLAAGRVPVVAGFIGSTVDGVTTTLGRGGADVTAAVVGSQFHAREIQIWGDRDGLPAADPSLVPGARNVPQLSYAEARELAYFGAKVLHPWAIDPAGARGIPVRLLNARRPDAAGTVVNGAAAADARRPAALACKRPITVLDIAARAPAPPQAFLRGVFEAFDRAGVHPCVTTTAGGRVTAAFDGSSQSWNDLAREMQESAHVTLRREMALLSAVGETLRTAPRLAGDLLSALDGIAVHGVSHPPSGLSWTVLLEEADLAEAVTRVYARFYADHEEAAS